MPKINIDTSYAEALHALTTEDQEAVDEWGVIVLALGAYGLYEPPSPPHSFQRNEEKRVCSCQHMTGWHGWVLSWEYETNISLEDPVTDLTIFATRSPQVRLHPNVAILARIVKR